MSAHEQEPEQELEEMQAQADSLGKDVEDVRDDWEAKKGDPAVPGAGGDTAAASPVGEEAISADEPLDERDPETEDL
jgi:hypothetical protein